MTDGKQSMTDIKQSVTDCSLSPRVFPANMRPVTLFWHFLDFSLKKWRFLYRNNFVCSIHGKISLLGSRLKNLGPSVLICDCNG